MKIALLLVVSPFALAVACGTRTELHELGVSSIEEDAGSDAGKDLGTEPVHCVGPPATAMCSAGTNCFLEGGKVVCGPPTGELNCGRVNCSGGCTCGGTELGSYCDCL